MLIQSLLIPKSNLNTVSVSDDLATALSILDDNNQRCLPVLDKSKTLFRGNIYRYHIYKHLAEGGKLTDSVMLLLKNATKFIYNTDSFFTLFFTLKDLPYISILDDKQQFLGIIRHEDVMKMLAESWRLTDASYTLTIDMPETHTSFLEVIKIIKKYTPMTNVITFDRDSYYLRKRLVVTLPQKLEAGKFEKLKQRLAKKNYRIIEIEDLTQGI